MREEEAWIADLFAEFGPVDVRRMFGGAGIMAGGRMIGIVFGETIYLRVDDEMRDAFVADGSQPFRFAKSSRNRVSTSYFSLPDRLYDDPDVLAEWARRALAVAPKKAKRASRARAKRPRS